MNNSFYGGRDGQPMIIKAKFPTVEEMTVAFSNPDYTTVNFGEYALIETINKKNPENGMLFRRGYDYFDDTRKVNSWVLNTDTTSPDYGVFTKKQIPAFGAIEIGKISGPSGDAPHLHFGLTETEVEQKIGENLYREDTDEFVSGRGALSVKIDEETEEHEGNLIPGRDSNGQITYCWCSIRDENGCDSNVYIGFTVPYFDLDITTNIQNPFYGIKGETKEPYYTRTQNENNPFYEQWTFNIPRGVKGDSIEWIRIAYENEYKGQLKQLEYDSVTGLPIQDENGSYKFTDYIFEENRNKQILVASIWQWNYASKTDINTIVYLSDYRTIVGMKYEDAEYKQGENGEIITVQKDGKIIIDYSDSTSQELLTVNPLTVGEDISFGKYNEPGENLRVNGIHFVLEGWDPNPEDEEKDYNVIHYPGGSLAPISEETLKGILI